MDALPCDWLRGWSCDLVRANETQFCDPVETVRRMEMRPVRTQAGERGTEVRT